LVEFYAFTLLVKYCVLIKNYMPYPYNIYCALGFANRKADVK